MKIEFKALNDYQKQEIRKEINELDIKYTHYLHQRNYDMMSYFASLIANLETILKNGRKKKRLRYKINGRLKRI